MKRPRPPVVTLTSDFGLRDTYAAEIKGRLLAICPELVLVDITHDVPPFDVEAGACLLARAIPSFPPGTVHLAVVDPGVGSARRGLVLITPSAFLVGPDNGLLAPFLAGARARALDPARVTDSPISPTFHGRDLFAPAAARLARGEDPASFSEPIEDPVRPPQQSGAGRIVHVDRFGNCVTNLDPAAVPSGGAVLVIGDHRIERFVRTYAEAPPGQPIVLVGSSGVLEVAVRDGSAALLLNLARGDRVRVEPPAAD